MPLINNAEFLIKESEIPSTPIKFSVDAKDWYREQKRRCVEGYWVGGKYMPPQLYFYVNFWNILLNKGKSKSKIISKPWLRDVEWEVFPAYLCARGLSGFDGALNVQDTPEGMLSFLKENNKSFGCPQYDNEATDLMVMTARETGKELADYEVVMTEDGEVPICDINIGDKIAGKEGYVKVVDKFPQGVKDIYRFTFGDGRVVDCGLNHLWSVYDTSSKNTKNLTTEQILNHGLTYGVKPRFRWRVPQCEAIEYPEKELPINPYLIGLLLGDGTMTTGTIKISTDDIEIVNNIKEILPDYELHKDTSNNNYNIVYCGKDKYEKESPYGKNPLTRKIREIGLNLKCEDKYIPKEYFLSSIEQRLELIRGLMDSDGSVTTDGAVEFINKSKKLIDGLAYILRSLGINCQIALDSREGNQYHICGNKNLFTHGRYYRLYIKTDQPIFKLSRKLNRIQKRKRSNKIRIVSIEKLEQQHSCTCIMVDKDDGLFLTSNFIVTHNSFIASALVAHEWLFNGQKNYLLPNEDGFQKTMANITVGAGDSKFSSRLLVKVKMGLDILASQGIEFAGRYYPHPFFQSYSGSWSPGKQIVAKYKKKVGGTWQEVGSMSTINHVSYKDNDYAAQGSRNSLMIKEECFGIGTKIVMHDLSKKNIEDVVVGDYVMGVDGLHKKVIHTTTGKSELYKIRQTRGIDYITTSNHKLYLEQRCRCMQYPDDGIKYITPSEFVLMNKYKQRTTYGVKNLNIEFKKQEVDIEPYFLGVWLGDGNSRNEIVYNGDIEIRDYLKEYSERLSLNYFERQIRDTNTYACSIKEGRYIQNNRLLNKIKEANLINNKHIPREYLINDSNNRLELLAGLIDSDGSLTKNAKGMGQCYEISAYKELGREIVLLAQTLGFNTYLKEYETYVRINIRGDISRIPVKIERKKCTNKRVQTCMTTQIFPESIGVGDYYGIQLEANCEQDKLFLLEDFTIVHNCGMFSNLEEAREADKETMMSGTSKYGTCIYIGTGGDMERGTLSAYKMFYSPTAYDIMSFEDKWEQKGKIGLFIPATMRPNEFKDSEGNTNYVIATEHFEKERELLRNSKNGSAPLNAFIQYNPIKPSEVFLRTNVNIFPVSEIKEWLTDLEVKQIYQDAEMVCELIFDENGNIKPNINKNLSAIRDFPLEKEKDSNGAVVIFHHPDTSDDGMIPYGRYIAGIDPYDADKSTTSSLGSMIVMDRLSNRVVAEYSGRPKFADMFYENCRRLSIYYNAATLYENEKMGVKQYYERKNSLQYLMRQPQYIKDVIPNSTVERGYGCHMNVALKDHGEILTRDWLQEEYEIGKLNVRKIRCVPLLKEMILYDSDHGNYDRVSAFLMCMYAMQELHKQKVVTAMERTRSRDPFFDRRLNQKSYKDYRNTNQPI